MGVSYRNPARQCLVDDFERMERERGESAWKAYCDCNFLLPVETEMVRIGGKLVAATARQQTSPGQFKSGPLFPAGITPLLVRAQGEDDRQWGARVKTLAANGVPGLFNPNSEVAITVEQYIDGGRGGLSRTEEWKKCVSNFCTLPTGCWNGTTEEWMGFNISPAMLAAPWTQLGAAARGIYKHDADFWYTLTQAFSIDASAYTPLNLWRNYFINPGVFWLNVGKLHLFPGIGTGLASALTAVTANPAGVPGPLFFVTILPAALTQCAAEQKDVFQYVVKPMALGSIDTAAAALRALGPALGQQYFEVAGIVLQKVANDQINSGEIDKVLDPFFKSVIVFFSKSGEELGRSFQKVVMGGGMTLETASGVLSVLAVGFNEVSKIEALPPEARAFCASAATVLRIIRGVSEAIQSGETPFAIADRIVFEVFGFSLDALQQAVQKGKAEVDRLLGVAKAKGKLGTLDGAVGVLDALGKVINVIAGVINKITNAIGGGLEHLRDTFNGFAGVLADTRRTTGDLVAQASGGGVVPTPAPNVSPAQPAATPPVINPGRVAPIVSGTSTIQTVIVPGTSSTGAALVGAGVGAALGGPAGAAIGGIAGLLFGGTQATIKQVGTPRLMAPIQKREISAEVKARGVQAGLALPAGAVDALAAQAGIKPRTTTAPGFGSFSAQRNTMRRHQLEAMMVNPRAMRRSADFGAFGLKAMAKGGGLQVASTVTAASNVSPPASNTGGTVVGGTPSVTGSASLVGGASFQVTSIVDTGSVVNLTNVTEIADAERVVSQLEKDVDAAKAKLDIFTADFANKVALARDSATRAEDIQGRINRGELVPSAPAYPEKFAEMQRLFQLAFDIRNKQLPGIDKQIAEQRAIIDLLVARLNAAKESLARLRLQADVVRQRLEAENKAAERTRDALAQQAAQMKREADARLQAQADQLKAQIDAAKAQPDPQLRAQMEVQLQAQADKLKAQEDTYRAQLQAQMDKLKEQEAAMAQQQALLDKLEGEKKQAGGAFPLIAAGLALRFLF